MQAAIACLHGVGAHLRRHGLAADRRAVRPARDRWPTPVVRVNRAVAVAEVAGPRAGLALLAELVGRSDRTMAPLLVDARRLPSPPGRDRRPRRTRTGRRSTARATTATGDFCATPRRTRSGEPNPTLVDGPVRSPDDPTPDAGLMPTNGPMIGTMRWIGERTPDGPFGRQKIAFVLSGGGSLGAMQAGQLLAMFEAGITPDLVIGVSAGALNGAAIAHQPTTAMAEQLATIWQGLRPRRHLPRVALRTCLARVAPPSSPLPIRWPARPRQPIPATRRPRPAVDAVRGRHGQHRRRPRRLPLHRRSPRRCSSHRPRCRASSDPS